MEDLPAESADERDLGLIVNTFPDKRYTVIPAYYGLLGPFENPIRQLTAAESNFTKFCAQCHNPVTIPISWDISGLHLRVFTQIQGNFTKPIGLCQLFSAKTQPFLNSFTLCPAGLCHRCLLLTHYLERRLVRESLVG